MGGSLRWKRKMVSELELPARGQDCRPAAGAPSTSSGRGLPDREQPRQAEGEGVRESSTELPWRAEEGGGMAGLRQGRSPVSPAGVNGLTSAKYDACTKRLTRTSSLEARGGARMYTLKTLGAVVGKPTSYRHVLTLIGLKSLKRERAERSRFSW